jgi:ER lumen protein retaining receptor
MHMNVFRLCGDFLHLGSIFILALKMFANKNCRGISLKTQFLYLLVFLTRYIDLFYNFLSLYNTVMKVIFIGSAFSIVYVMKFKSPYCDTYDKKYDNFFLPYIIVPCAILALLVNEYFSFSEILWTFSIYLEAIAIVPQLIVVHQYAKETDGFVENLTSHYVFALGGYRALYLFNWIYRFFTEPGYRDWIVWVSGVIQTAIYSDFFYYYIVAQATQQNVHLPI